MEIFGYNIYFWSNEGTPLEPVHVSKNLHKNATKIWILKNGNVKVANNNSHIPRKDLTRIKKIIKNFAPEIIKEWENYYKVPVKFYNGKSIEL
jgi:hypothetical protein